MNKLNNKLFPLISCLLLALLSNSSLYASSACSSASDCSNKLANSAETAQVNFLNNFQGLFGSGATPAPSGNLSAQSPANNNQQNTLANSANNGSKQNTASINAPTGYSNNSSDNNDWNIQY